MGDEEGIIEHLRELDEALKDWERYRQSLSLGDLRLDRDKQNMTLHAILIAIQAAIDVGNHLIVEYSLRRPNTYRETFEIISEAGLISLELSEGLSDLAGFRNVLVIDTGGLTWRRSIRFSRRIWVC